MKKNIGKGSFLQQITIFPKKLSLSADCRQSFTGASFDKWWSEDATKSRIYLPLLVLTYYNVLQRFVCFFYLEQILIHMRT